MIDKITDYEIEKTIEKIGKEWELIVKDIIKELNKIIEEEKSLKIKK